MTLQRRRIRKVSSKSNKHVMETKLQHEDALNKLKALVKHGDICMFTTVDKDLKIKSRPLTTADVDEDGNIWFFTNEFSEKIHDLSTDNSVNLIYSNPDKNTYVDIHGSCVVVVNKQKNEQLWNPFLKAWFPNGLDDPKLCLLKVMTEEAFFWNSSSNKMVVAFNMLKAIVSKEKYDEGEQGKLSLATEKHG